MSQAFNQLYPFKHAPSGQILLNRNEKYLREAIARSGEYSPDEAEVFTELVRPDDIMVEVGANYGAHTLVLAQLARIVLALEPQMYVYQALCANLALNSILNVQALQMALGATCASQTMMVLNPLRENNFGGFQALDAPGDSEVQVRTLDSMELPQVDFLKLDVEGAELRVLQGAERTILRDMPLIYMEYTSQREALLEWLLAHDYHAVRHITLNAREPNWLGTPAAQLDSAGSDNVLAYPAGKPPHDAEFLRRHNFMMPTYEDMWGAQSYKVLLQWPS